MKRLTSITTSLLLASLLITTSCNPNKKQTSENGNLTAETSIDAFASMDSIHITNEPDSILHIEYKFQFLKSSSFQADSINASIAQVLVSGERNTDIRQAILDAMSQEESAMQKEIQEYYEPDDETYGSLQYNIVRTGHFVHDAADTVVAYKASIDMYTGGAHGSYTPITLNFSRNTGKLIQPSDIFDMEPDAGLGNGGLGRLAACYLDSMTTLDIPATGYSICYELGIFKQKIVEGQQVELPDDWKNLGDAWLMPKPQEAEEVHFGGKIRSYWDNGHHMVIHEDYTRVLAIPCDMEVAGYGTEHVNTLRLWDAKSPKPIDMQLFRQGQYLRSGEEQAMADVISKILYPEDNHYEGKSLRLKQQYFFVSATVQNIVKRHLEAYGTTAVNYNRDVEAFPIVKTILTKITGDENFYRSPTDMGVNMAGYAIIDDDICCEASRQEIIRRFFQASCQEKQHTGTKGERQRIELLMRALRIEPESRRTVPAALSLAARTKKPAVAIELPDGQIVTGRTTVLLGPTSAALLNALKGYLKENI